MSQINEKNVTSFFNNVPVSIELPFLGLCLGAPIAYETDANTGLKNVSMLIPQGGKTVQPVIVTIGKEDCIAPNARTSIYKACHLEDVLNNVGDPLTHISERFISKCNMNANNDYIKTFYGPKFAILREEVVKRYPEEVSTLDNVKEAYVSILNKAFSSGKSEDDKKKQIMM